MPKLTRAFKALPVNPADILKEGKTFKESRDKSVVTHLIIDPRADDETISDARLLLVPETAAGIVTTTVLGSQPSDKLDRRAKRTTRPEAGPDMAVFVIGELSDETNGPLISAIESHRAQDVPFVVITKSVALEHVARELHIALSQIVSARTFEEMALGLAAWIAQNADDNRLAFAANFEFARHSVAMEFVRATSLQNGVVGGVAFIPGADMPILTLNQIKMVLQIAAAYGAPLDAARVKEIASVVATAFVSRTIARELVSLVPGIGWALKAGVAYGATYALGVTLLEYYARGVGDVSLKEFMNDARSALLERARAYSKQRPTGKEIARKTTGFASRAAKETKRLYIESKGARD